MEIAVKQRLKENYDNKPAGLSFSSPIVAKL